MMTIKNPWDQVPANLPAPELSSIALTILKKRYLKPAGEHLEEPSTMFWRVARFVAQADSAFGDDEPKLHETALRFYHHMVEGRFEPNSPTLMNAGRPLGQLSACFVLPVDDALSNGQSGIYDTLTSMALIHQSGGGTGFSFSKLRPKGDMVRSSTGVASGPVSFMKLYDASTDVVKQGGTRRGANMGILRIDHPDILNFIASKEDTSQITNFNISVAVTDDFMIALRNKISYDLIHPITREVVERLDAVTVWDLIVESAWATGEPGIFFIDCANYYNPVPHLGDYEATNPCGEQPLLPYDVCNLGSINLSKFIDSGKINWDKLSATIYDGVHFLDNVIDQNKFPLTEIRDRADAIRRVGLGVMGWADMLIELNIPYNSVDGVNMARAVMGFVEEESRKASEGLARMRGVFPEWEKSIWGPDKTCARGPAGERIRPERKLRNSNLTTVAPTGTISMIAGCSGGIEPLFAVAFMRNQAGARMADVNAAFVACAKAEGWHSEELMLRIANQGNIHFDEVPETVQQSFVTAHDIAPEWHVRMQTAFQEHVDSAISKTTNFSFDATKKDVRTIYELAYDLGAKGVTVYRDGSRPMQVLSTGKTDKKATPIEDTRSSAEIVASLPKRSRPQILQGTTVKTHSPVGDMYVTINEDADGDPFEVFCNVGKAGGAANADSEAIGRLISLALRHYLPIEEVRDQLRGISTDKAVGFGSNKVLSGPDAIAQAIDCYLQRKGGDDHVAAKAPQETVATCPDCKSGNLTFEEGCMKCHTCGYSACG